MKKLGIGIIIAIILVIIVYFLLPPEPKSIIEYHKLRLFKEDGYEEIEIVRNAKVLGQGTVTYGEIVDELVAHEYWTCETNVADPKYPTLIKAYGDNFSLTTGDNADTGIYSDSELRMEFYLDQFGGYNLVVYLNNKELPKEERDALLDEMCDYVR